MLLQVAAGTRLLDETAALNITYTASVAAVDAIPPNANHGSSCHTALLPRFKILSRQLLWTAFAPPLNPGGMTYVPGATAICLDSFSRIIRPPRIPSPLHPNNCCHGYSDGK